MKKSHKVTIGVVGGVVVLVLIIGLFLYVLCNFLVPVFIIASIGSTTVVETAYSPDGQYYAELINDDQGAMGGSTCIKVYKTEPMYIDFLGILPHDSEIIYSGPWGEFDYMDISFTDDDTVLVHYTDSDTYSEYGYIHYFD